MDNSNSEPSQFPELEARPPARLEDLRKAEAALGISLPDDYKAFLLKQNGGDGFIGGHYVVFWSTDELSPFNREYEIAAYAPGFVGFGSNGGGDAFAFDTREVPFTVVQAPFIGMSVEDGIRVASSFTELLDRMRTEGQLF